MLFDLILKRYEKELIAQLGISRTTLWNWKNKKTLPNISTIRRIKKHFKINNIYFKV